MKKKKKRRRIIAGKVVDYKRCQGCSFQYKGIIRDGQGNIERIISCQTNCPYLKRSLVKNDRQI